MQRVQGLRSSEAEVTEVLMHTTIWMSLENIMLSEGSQSQRVSACLIPFKWNIQKTQIHRDRKQTGCQGLGTWGTWSDCYCTRSFFSGNENVLNWIEVIVARLSECSKRHRIVQLQKVNSEFFYVNFVSIFRKKCIWSRREKDEPESREVLKEWHTPVQRTWDPSQERAIPWLRTYLFLLGLWICCCC